LHTPVFGGTFLLKGGTDPQKVEPRVVCGEGGVRTGPCGPFRLENVSKII